MPFTEEQMKQVFDTNIIDFAVRHGFEVEKGDRNTVHVKHSGGLYLFRHAKKNNDQEQVGIIIKKEGQEIAARVFLEEYYARFPDWVSDETILQTIAGDYLENESRRGWAEDITESVKNFDSIKENIRVEVVNRDMNQESLRDCPKKEIEGTDLLAVFRILFYEQGKECASALVTHAAMEKWGI